MTAASEKLVGWAERSESHHRVRQTVPPNVDK